MALRKMRIMGEDDCLREVCREVKVVTPKITQLIDDMLDTMYDQQGVGLAAPQVGILKRIVVIDVGEGPIVMINPKILETSGTQRGSEGCLSVPGKNGTVTRPMWVKAEFYGEDMEKYVIAGEDCATSMPGVFVAGDARKKQLRQIITAVADGANAVTSVGIYLTHAGK